MSIIKGWLGERKTAAKLWLSLDKKTYKRIHNVIIPSFNGTTQIDHILVSPFGLFIVETKNYTGWIFGSEDSATWTKTVYNKKYTFQNPLRQTFRHKKVLAEYLNLHEIHIHPIVIFVGDCKFKTKMPANVLRKGLGRYIKKFNNVVLSEQEIAKIISQLKSEKSTSAHTNRTHKKSLRQRHKSTTICPKCGSDLTLRIAKQGARSGKKFYGCTNFPKCRFTRNA